MLLSDHKPTSGPGSDAEESAFHRHAARRRIMAAGKHRYASIGVENVTLLDVASDAGVDWDEFLLYFHDKDELLSAILEDGWQGLLPRIGEITARAVTAHSALVTLFAFVTEALHKDEDLLRLLLFEARRPNPDVGEIGLSSGDCQFTQICSDLILRGQRDGSFKWSYHPNVAASMLIGALEGLLRDRLIAEQEHGATAYTGIYVLSTYDALVSSLKH